MARVEAGASEALVSFLDATFAQVAAELAAPHDMDRDFLVEGMNLWLHHTFGTFQAAACLTRWGRDRAAAAELRDMWSWAGPQHRAWMVEQLNAAGLDTGRLFDHATTSGPPLPYRDHAGDLQPVRVPLSAAVAQAMLADYEFAGGRLVRAAVKHRARGAAPAEGSLAVAAGRRRFPHTSRRSSGDPYDRHWMGLPGHHFAFDRIDGFDLPDGGDGAEITLTGEPEFAFDGTAVTITLPLGRGRHASVRADGVTYLPRDLQWHLSGAAAAVTEVEPPQPTGRQVRRGAWQAISHSAPVRALVAVQHYTFQAVRTMRFPQLFHRAHLASAVAVCLGLPAATARIVAMGRGEQQRAAARRLLAEVWEVADDRGRDHLARVLSTYVPDGLDLVPQAAAHQRYRSPHVPVTADNGATLADPVDFTGGRVRLVEHCDDRRLEDASLVLHLEGRRRADGAAVVAVVEQESVVARELRHLPDSVLVGPPRWRTDDDGAVLTLPLSTGTWSCTSAKARWYPDPR
ncbi:hypothetical protein QEZ54_22305 [Catellatospora sp. KI3]|uniref:hypothetical protein n=1 Tax=Catellatospora sp. KI3 TaxID=3041620 RepID=UPI002482700F|nr:hypothetical protein [Catellatospora sp. KI3]MDI1463720.1 hypothetical protein [Catellatospora sp. KI3]